jgi:hypothetical protein
MTRTSKLFFIGSFLWLLSGCVINGDPAGENAFEGTFKVTTHTRNEMDCATPGADVTDGDKFFKLSEETLFGTKILAYRSCTDATTCASDLSLFESFIDEGKGWMRQVKTSSGSSTTCSLGLVEGPLVETETGFTLDTKTSKGEVMLVADEKCDTDLVDPHRTDLMCTGIESLVAERQ